MTIRVDVSRLPPDVAEALERGDSIEFEHDGEVVTVARVDAPDKPGLWEALAKLPPLDDGFERDIEETLAAVLRPQPYAWEQ